jgi:hypothetical protein
MKNIESLTPEQEALIPVIRQKWLNLASTPIDKQKVKDSISALYQYAGKPIPKHFLFVKSLCEALIFLSSIKTVSLGGSLRDSLRDSLGDSLGDSLRGSLWGSLRGSLRDSLWDSLRGSLRDCMYPEWLQSWAAFFEFGSKLGVLFDEAAYSLYIDYCYSCGWVFPYENLVIVCDRPQVSWDDEGRIHSEVGPAISFESGWQVWAVNGVVVNQQIVLAPETQTLDQISQEHNEEVRRIRITRYGWINYLREVGATVLDTVQSPGGWMEALMQTNDFKVLCTYDPSTGRPYALEVSNECFTCEQAQNYLAGFSDDAALQGLGVTIKSSYPVIRT